jgi:hypothetical protein
MTKKMTSSTKNVPFGRRKIAAVSMTVADLPVRSLGAGGDVPVPSGHRCG